jgi:opacity protein-like surface antigen
MKSFALLLSIAAVALSAPVAADAGQGHGQGRGRGGGGGGWRNDGGGPPIFVGGPGRGRGGDRGDRGSGRGGPPPQYYPMPGRGQMRPGPVFRPRQDSLGAGWREQQDEARSGVRQGRFVPLSRVLPQLQRRMPGRQLDAGIEQGWRGQAVYRVRWAGANGRRVDFLVDARTGAILSTEGQ